MSNSLSAHFSWRALPEHSCSKLDSPHACLPEISPHNQPGLEEAHSHLSSQGSFWLGLRIRRWNRSTGEKHTHLFNTSSMWHGNSRKEGKARKWLHLLTFTSGETVVGRDWTTWGCGRRLEKQNYFNKVCLHRILSISPFLILGDK